MNSKSMIRTFAFAGVAIVSTILAIAANQFTKPAKIDGEGDYGRDFNPDFTDAAKATTMRVVAWDEATATPKRFAVEYKNGWKIPTYHDYPADGKDQLAKAAASVIGLKRGSLASRYKTDHERMGVIDPLDEENPATKGRGTRITLMDGEVTLADFIVGNKVEGGEDKHYLRKYGEDKVYKVAAKFEVSTKFSDWAETDLLKASGWDITRLRGSRPKINADDEYEGDEVVELTREKSGDPWKLAELDEATEELKSDDINTMVNTLDDLKLVGVRPRPAFQGKPILNSQLKVDLPAELRANPQVLNEVKRVLLSDLGEKGFKVGQDAEGQTQIVSREGELMAGTKDGVLYRLTFGSVFTGTEQEIEVGTKPDAAADEEGKKKAPAKENKDDQKKSRYLIVRVDFDDKLLGAPPVEPTKPIPPPGVEPLGDAKEDDKKEASEKSEDTPKKDEKKPESKPDESKDSDKPADAKKDAEEAAGAKQDDAVAAAEDKKPEEKKKDDADKDDKKPAAENKDTEKKDDKKDEPTADKPKADSTDPKKDDAKPDEPKKDLKAEYFEAVKRYDAEKGRFVAEAKAFEAKVEAGKQKVKELNDRFADWYYVISNDSFDKLRLSRADLVKPKEKPAEKTDADKKEGDKKEGDDAAKPAANDDKPAEKEKKEPEKKEDEKSGDDK